MKLNIVEIIEYDLINEYIARFRKPTAKLGPVTLTVSVD